MTKYIQLNEGILSYISNNSSIEQDPALKGIRSDTLTDFEKDAIMLLDPEAGGLLSILTRCARPKTILELGTFTGYGTLCLASASGSESVVHTCDTSDRGLAIAEKYWELASVMEKILFHHMPAIQFLDSYDETVTFDLIFIDADKENYPFYFKKAMNRLSEGGVIVIDNALRHGDVVNPRTEDERAVAETNQLAFKDQRCVNVILPIGDGLQICYKTA